MPLTFLLYYGAFYPVSLKSILTNNRNMVSGFDYILNKCFAREIPELCLALSVLCGCKTIPPPIFRQLRLPQIKIVPLSFVLRVECATNPRLGPCLKAWETQGNS